MSRGALALCLLLVACAPAPKPVFQPLSFRAELPTVVVYPHFVFPGQEVAITARSVRPGATTCLDVVDGDATPWFTTCGPDETRRVMFRPRHAGRHVALVYIDRGEGVPGRFLYGQGWAAEFCVLGEGADCP